MSTGIDGRDDTDEYSITDDIVSDSPYRRKRAERWAQFSAPLQTKIAWKSGIMAALILVLPLYQLFPRASEIAWLGPAADASPKVLLLGVVGLGIESVTGTVLVAVGLYRLHAGPVDEDTAATLLDLEDTAASIGLVSGGLAVLVTLAYFVLGAFGSGVIVDYVAVFGANPYVDSGTGVTVGHLAVVALMVSTTLWTVRQYLVFELWKLDRGT